MATQPNQYQDDPFADESAPSLSFRDAPIGTVYTGTITRVPHLVNMRDFESHQPKTWPDGNPVMGVVLSMEVDELGGEVRSLWAQKPSSMFSALAKAQKNADSGPMQIGGRLAVKFVGTTPNVKSPHLNPRKDYDARYEPPVPAAPADAFANQPIAPAPVQQQAPVQQPLRPAQPQAPAPQPQAQTQQKKLF